MQRLVLALVVAVSLAAPAAAFRAQNGLHVWPEEGTGGAFVVSWSGRSGAPAFWCAAGDYAIHGLGLPTGTQIYRYSAPPRRSGEGIAFGFDPSRAQRTGLVRLVGGRSVAAAHARTFCDHDRLQDH